MSVDVEKMPDGRGGLGEIIGDEIVDVQVIRGGSLYCDKIEMRLKSGKHLVMDRHLQICPGGINPRIKYRIGAWFEFSGGEKTK